MKTYSSQALAGHRSINYTNEGKIMPRVRCLTYGGCFSSPGPLKANWQGWPTAGGLFLNQDLPPDSKKIIGRGLWVGPNKTHLRMRVWG